jgi:hypothetical protein
MGENNQTYWTEWSASNRLSWNQRCPLPQEPFHWWQCRTSKTTINHIRGRDTMWRQWSSSESSLISSAVPKWVLTSSRSVVQYPSISLLGRKYTAKIVRENCHHTVLCSNFQTFGNWTDPNLYFINSINEWDTTVNPISWIQSKWLISPLWVPPRYLAGSHAEVSSLSLANRSESWVGRQNDDPNHRGLWNQWMWKVKRILKERQEGKLKGVSLWTVMVDVFSGEILRWVVQLKS